MALPSSLLRKLECKQNAVRAVRYNFDGDYCISCGSDKSVKLWNPVTGRLLQTYTGHGYEVLDAQGSCDNSHIVSAGMDKVAFLWDVSTSQAVRRFRGHAGYINAVKFNEESTVILSASVDLTVRAWDCRSKSREPIQILNEAKDAVTSLCVSDHEIITSSLDCCVRRYDLRVGKLYQDNLESDVTSVALTKDGGCILASCQNSTIKLLDKESGDVLSEYSGHKNTQYRIDSCLTDTDAQIVSGSEDGCVYFWDLIDTKLIQTLKHEDQKVVHSLSYHPTKPILLTAAGAFIHVWGLPPEKKFSDDDLEDDEISFS